MVVACGLAGLPGSDWAAAACTFQPTSVRHAKHLSLGGGPPGASRRESGSPQSAAGSRARLSRRGANDSRVERELAGGPNAGRHNRRSCLPGHVAECRESPRSRTLYRRGVADRRYLLDLDDAGWSQFAALDLECHPSCFCADPIVRTHFRSKHPKPPLNKQ
jgi:hypothetical protein